MTANDQKRLDRYLRPGQEILSAEEKRLLAHWVRSRDGHRIEAAVEALKVKGFAQREIADWLRWLLRPFLTHDLSRVVQRTWRELSATERTAYLSVGLKVILKTLSRRSTAEVRLLEAAALLDEHDFRRKLAVAIGIAPKDPARQILALLDD